MNYTGKDGGVLVGTLAEIGETLIHGDRAVGYYGYGVRALQDNTQPWVELYDREDGTVGEIPRRFTVAEWITWAGTVEDRDERDVAQALTGPRLELDTAEIAAPRDEIGSYRRFSITDTALDRTLEYATNRAHDGLWIKTRDGYDQIAGTHQASITTEAEAVRFLRDKAATVWGVSE